jgi:hypothetical protein
MKRFPIALCAVLLVATGTMALAGNPVEKARPTSGTAIAAGELTPTPDMWFYQQYQQQYQNPKEMVHRNADFKAAERLRRLNSQKWFGASNQRPKVTSDPYNGDYTASWVSSNPFYPNRWQSFGVPVAIYARDRNP